MCMKAGIKMHDTKGVDFILKEIQQFYDRGVVKPLKSDDITSEW